MGLWADPNSVPDEDRTIADDDDTYALNIANEGLMAMRAIRDEMMEMLWMHMLGN